MLLWALLCSWGVNAVVILQSLQASWADDILLASQFLDGDPKVPLVCKQGQSLERLNMGYKGISPATLGVSTGIRIDQCVCHLQLDDNTLSTGIAHAMQFETSSKNNSL